VAVAEVARHEQAEAIVDHNRRAARILIVDRDHSSRRALGSLLEELGHDVGLAPDWIAARELARVDRYGLVIAEVERGQRAADTVHDLSAEPALRDVPIILVTRDGEVPGDWLRHRPWVVDSIRKPIDIPRMLASIDDHAHLEAEATRVERCGARAASPGR